MKTFAALVVALLVVPALVQSQEPVERELEFVQKLRAKGYFDLAKEYLDLLAKRNDPKLTAVLPLEQARVLIAQAREKDPDQRAALFAAARGQLDAFIAKNAGTVEAARATLERARLSAYHGQALLTKALRQDDKTLAHAEARPAEAMFLLAQKDLAEAVKAIQAVLDKVKDPDPATKKAIRKQLEQDLSEARFDQGINYIDQARTYIDTAREDTNRKRAEIIGMAQKVFKELEGDESSSVGILANAWLMKVSMEQQSPQDSVKYYKRVIGQTSPAARAGQRWVRLFLMQDIPINPEYFKGKKVTAAEKYALIEREGKLWLRDYPNYTKAPEGQGVLWELASAYYLQAEQVKDQKSKAATALYDTALKYYDQLAQTDGDLAYKANQVALALRFQRMEKNADLRTFDDYFLKGSYEFFKASQLSAKIADAKQEEAKKLEAETKSRLKAAAKAMTKAINLSTSKTPIKTLDEAKQKLTWSYHLSGDWARAAIAGENLGRTRPLTRYAGEGAAIALSDYSAIYFRDRDDAARAQLKDLADYVLQPESQKFWASDRVSDIAHYELAMLQEKDDQYKTAIEHLRKLNPDFPRYLYAQGQLVFTALQGRDKAKTDAEKDAYTTIVRQALERMPPLPSAKADLDPATATMYFTAKMEQPRLMYADAYADVVAGKTKEAVEKYRAMAKYVKELNQQFDKLPIKLTPETQKRLDFGLDVWLKYSDYGIANVEFKKGEYEKVIAATKGIVDRTLEEANKLKEGEKIKFRDFRVTGDVLGLALRAYVQKGNIDMGKKLLNALQRLSSTNALEFLDSGAIVRNLLTEISKQVDDLRASKNPKDAERLKAMIGNFTSFLDEIGKDYQKKGFDPQSATLLASAYASLDQHEKAAETFAKIAAPSFLDKDKLDDMEAKEVSTYWYFQIQRAREMRLAKKDYKEAEQVLNTLLRHKNAKNQILADMEKTYLLEDQGYWGPAIVRWNSFVKNRSFAGQLGQPEVQKIFFAGAFHRFKSMVMYAKDPKVKSPERFLAAAAHGIVQIENTPDQIGWSIMAPMARELIASEPAFRTEYERQKAAAK